MWRKLLITTAVVAGVFGMATVNTDAREMRFGARSSANVKVHTGVHAQHGRVNARTHSDFNARAQVRTPPGWSHGTKRGWNCHLGTRGCIPPGLRK